MRFTMSTGEKESTAETPVIIEQPEVRTTFTNSIEFFSIFETNLKNDTLI